MARYIDADALIEEIMPRWIQNLIWRAIERLPTADVVEVTRCRDCCNWWSDANGNHFCAASNISTHDEFYCADGERRANDG